MTHRPAACAALLAAALLPSCAAAPTDLIGPTYTVTDLYTTPGEPSALPPSAAGTMTLTVGRASFVATTACATIHGAAHLDDTTLTLTDVTAATPGACDDAQRAAHDTFAGLLTTDATFAVTDHGDGEFVLTARTGAVDAPALRLLAL